MSVLSQIKEKYPDLDIETRDNNQIYVNNESIDFMLPEKTIIGVSHAMRQQVEKAMFNQLCDLIDKKIKGE